MKTIKYFSYLLIFLLAFNFALAQGCADEGWKGFAKLHENKTICLTCPTCDYINLTATNPSGNIFLSDVSMQKNGATFCYTFLGENITQIGTFLVDGYSQLDIPLGLCFDATLSGNKASPSAYIIALLLIIFIFVCVIWINVKFNSKEREKLWRKMVTEYFSWSSNKNKNNLAYALLYTIAYALLRMIFVVYYLLGLIFIVIFTELVTAFSINTFTTLMPQVLNIALLGLIIIFVVFIAIFFEIIVNLMKDIELMLRGIE